MCRALFIKANNRSKTESVSVQLYDAFLQSFRESQPKAQVAELDLFQEHLPYLDANLANGIQKIRENELLAKEEEAALRHADRYLEQFLAADKIVFAFPLWNMTIPAVLHTYLDYLNREGKTFRYEPMKRAFVGLLGGKKVALLNARGGIYSEGPLQNYEMGVNYIRNMLHLYGVKKIETIIVEGHHSFLGLPKNERESAKLINEGRKKAQLVAKHF